MQARRSQVTRCLLRAAIMPCLPDIQQPGWLAASLRPRRDARTRLGGGANAPLGDAAALPSADRDRARRSLAAPRTATGRARAARLPRRTRARSAPSRVT